MKFPFDLCLLAFAGAFVGSLISLPLWRRWCLRTGHVDDPGHRKIQTAPVPLAGGLAVLTGLLLPLAGGSALLFSRAGSGLQPLQYGLEHRGGQMLALAVGAAAIFTLGWLDDHRELKPLPKFLGQLLVALLVASASNRATLFVPSLLFSYIITILWILTLINAFNFMDNMNGLCTGLGAIAALQFAVFSGLHGQYLITLVALVTAGALLGFLPHNFPGARAFLGDAGSHLVGYLMAVLALLPHFYTRQNPRPWAVFSPLAILAVPLADLVWVALWRWRNGKPFYLGDTNHLSHRLVRLGLSRSRAVLVIWLIAAALGSLAFF